MLVNSERLNGRTKPQILVVEDERVVARDIESSLKLMGYDVVGTVASSEDCLSRAADHRPDLVLMDVRIAGTVDGVETARHLRARFDIPVVYLTAYADDSMVERARETEPLGYVLKPFRIGELRSAIEIALFKHQADLKLKSRERWFSTTLRAIGDAVIAVDGDTNVTFVNRAAEGLLRLKEADAKGRPIASVLKLVDERTRKPVEHPIHAALRERKIARLPPNTAITNGQDERPIDDSIAPILDDFGELLGAVVVFRDVSEERRLRERIELADRMASLGILAAGVAHEINNPLTYVVSNASVAAAELDRVNRSLERLPTRQDPELRRVLKDVGQWLEEIEEGAERIKRIVKDLAVFARPDASSDHGDVVGALEWAARVSEPQLLQRARVVKELRQVPHVTAADARLGQVFLNLLLNAAQAIPEGNPTENSVVLSTSREGSDWVVVRVRDTGSGMSPEIARRIFEPFFTTKPIGAGMGLGLSICHGIVASVGGTLSVESVPGRGSTFTVRLPIAAGRNSPERDLDSSSAGRPHRLLLIDDEPRLATAVARMMRTIHEVVIVTSGQEALDRLAIDKAFDIVFCDLMMPNMSGMDVHRTLSQSDPELAKRMVFITGGAFSPRAVEFLASVPNPHIVKPFSSAYIMDFVQTFARDMKAPD
jgi:PAS domain S-box-containing protein